MKTTDIVCAGSSPSAPARGALRRDMADAFGVFCALAVPIEMGVRDLFDQAQSAVSAAELDEIWRELDNRRAERSEG